jgi:hypothetical protein
MNQNNDEPFNQLNNRYEFHEQSQIRNFQH